MTEKAIILLTFSVSFSFTGIYNHLVPISFLSRRKKGKKGPNDRFLTGFPTACARIILESHACWLKAG
jgi:hypothetical protein